MVLDLNIAPNPALQRTRSAPLRSPLSFESLGLSWTLLPVLLWQVGGLAAASPCRPTKLPEAVRKLVIPVLKAHADVMYPLGDGTFGYREGSEADEKFQGLYYGVLELKTRASDEALAALLWFYLGDHPHEELTCEIRSRGQHMLPILAMYSLCRPETPGVTLPAQSMLASVVVDELVADIKNGETCRWGDD